MSYLCEKKRKEMDGYKWVTLDEAVPLLHETQSVCIEKIKTHLSERD